MVTKSQEMNKEDLKSVEVLGLSPVKLVSKRDRAGYGKRKFGEVISVTKEKFATVLGVDPVSPPNEEVQIDSCCQKRLSH